jgi:hypothetical protein
VREMIAYIIPTGLLNTNIGVHGCIGVPVVVLDGSDCTEEVRLDTRRGIEKRIGSHTAPRLVSKDGRAVLRNPNNNVHSL